MFPTRIFLDLDDVCNRFTMFALAHVGCPVDPMTFCGFDPAWGFDILTAVNALHPRVIEDPDKAFTLAEFWSLFTRSTWANVPESDEFFALLANCEALVGTENICILTSPINDPECLAGKLDWIHEHFPARMHRQYLIGPCKHFCARPDALLIDDSDANVNAFREAGGQAVLLPRPWNTNHEFLCYWPAPGRHRYLNRVFSGLFKEKKQKELSNERMGIIARMTW